MNTFTKRIWAIRLWALAAAVLCAMPASEPRAQTYPARALRLVVPFPPGGPTDTLARAFAAKMNEAWGQPVVVENRGGAGGNIGSENVAKSAPDGYTLMLSASSHAINPAVYKSITWDPIKDFTPIILLASGPFVLVVHPSLPVASVKELIAHARAEPGIAYASAGNGTANHLAGELFKILAKVNMTHIPYKGAGPATTDLLAGHVKIMFNNMVSAMPHVKAGNLRVLAVTTTRRSSALPEMPTVAESGVPGFDIGTWYGIWAPAGVPANIVTKLNRELGRELALPDVRERLLLQGVDPEGGTPRQFADFQRNEVAKWARAARESNARVD